MSNFAREQKLQRLRDEYRALKHMPVVKHPRALNMRLEELAREIVRLEEEIGDRA